MHNWIGRNLRGTWSRSFAALVSVALLGGAFMVSVLSNPAVQSAGAAANAVIPTSASPGTSASVINNYAAVSFPANDDGTYPCGGDGNEPPPCTGTDTGPATVPLGFNINFFGTEFSSAYVNNNGNITFAEPLSEFTPSDLTTFGSPIVAAYFADVDTTGSASNLANFGTGTLNGQKVFVVNWPGVGCFSGISSVLNNFQLILIDRADRGTTALGDDFDMEFNYNSVQWDTGTASSGDATCQNASSPGTSAYVGYSNGTPTPGDSFNLPGSGVDNAFLDSASTTGLIFNDLNSTTLGRYLFTVNSGQPTQPTTLATSLSGGGQSGASIAVPPSTAVMDAAVLSGSNAATATGTVTYNVYSDNTCTTAVSTGTPESITTPGTLPASSAVSLPTGTYYWQAVYSGDGTNNGSTSTCGATGEVETVTGGPIATATSIATSLSGGGQSGTSISVPPSTAVMDAAVLSGSNAATATGTVTYNVYSDSGCTTAVSTGTPESITTPGTLPASSAVSLPTGTYYWQAVYSGDGTNNGSTSTCGATGEVETVTAGPTNTSTSIATSLSGGGQSGASISVPPSTAVTDAAVLSGSNAATATGTVTYTVYSDSSCTTAVSSGPETITTPGVMPDSAPVTLTAAGTYYWQATYSGDASNEMSTSACGSEVEIVNCVSLAPTTITTSLAGGLWSGDEWNGYHGRDVVTASSDTAVTDAATLSGANVSTAGGTVTYTVYSALSHNEVATDTEPVVNGVVTGSNAVLLQPGLYYWQASYSGDALNQPSHSDLGSEIELVIPSRNPHPGRCSLFRRF